MARPSFDKSCAKESSAGEIALRCRSFMLPSTSFFIVFNTDAVTMVKSNDDMAFELSEVPIDKSRTSPDSGSENIVAHTVPRRYRGTEVDYHDMRALGKTQVLRRNFKLLGMIAFANSVMVMWETFLVVSGLGLSVGGRAPVFWGLIYGAVAMPCIYVTIAEMAKIAPTAGGKPSANRDVYRAE